MSLVAADKFGVVRKKSKLDDVSLQQKINRIQLLTYWYSGSFLSDYVSTPDNDTFAIINTQPRKMQVEDWILIAKFRQEMYFADSLGRKLYRFLKQHYKQLMPIAVATECLLFRYDSCSFSSLQVVSRRNHWISEL